MSGCETTLKFVKEKMKKEEIIRILNIQDSIIEDIKGLLDNMTTANEQVRKIL